MQKCALMVPVALIALFGCSSPQTYEGTSRPENELIILTKAKGTHVHIVSIDGKLHGAGDVNRLEFLPGVHLIRVEYMKLKNHEFWTSRHSVGLSFDGKAGSHLQIICEEGEDPSNKPGSDENKGWWQASIVDVNTNEKVSTQVP